MFDAGVDEILGVVIAFEDWIQRTNFLMKLFHIGVRLNPLYNKLSIKLRL